VQTRFLPVMMTTSTQTASAPEAKLTAFLESKLSELHYELVAIEILNHREKKLRIYIDQQGGVGIEDCVKVTHELDAPLEASSELAAVFKGEYELEVSSPGLDRPLRKPSDYEKFIGQVVRLTTFRPLIGSETLAEDYSAKNPKQKNFFGLSRGFEAATNSILFGIVPEDGTGKKPKLETLIRIPLELVAKANLEPEIEIPDES
jgi:ribosome maturation factor RimP